MNVIFGLNNGQGICQERGRAHGQASYSRGTPKKYSSRGMEGWARGSENVHPSETNRHGDASTRRAAPPRAARLQRGSSFDGGDGGGYQPRSQELARILHESAPSDRTTWPPPSVVAAERPSSSLPQASQYVPAPQNERPSHATAPHLSLYGSLSSNAPSSRSSSQQQQPRYKSCGACGSQADATSTECQICGEPIALAKREMKKCTSCESPADLHAPECQICGEPFPPAEKISYQNMMRSRSASPPQVVPYKAEQHRPLVWLMKGLKIRTPTGPREVRIPVLESAEQKSPTKIPGTFAAGEDAQVGRWL